MGMQGTPAGDSLPESAYNNHWRGIYKNTTISFCLTTGFLGFRESLLAEKSREVFVFKKLVVNLLYKSNIIELIYFIAVMGVFALACLIYGLIGIYKFKHSK